MTVVAQDVAFSAEVLLVPGSQVLVFLSPAMRLDARMQSASTELPS